MKLRTEAYRKGVLKAHKAAVPVISIGNLVAGGTGKTPLVVYVARLVMNKGLRVAILSRGYRRKSPGRSKGPFLVSDGTEIKCGVEQAGDEPYMMARCLLGSKEKPGAMVIVGKDRAAGAGLAAEMGAQVVILDDGFQHLRLKRDLDIVLLDCHHPFGNGWVLPAGMLRETKGCLKRADAIVYTRCDDDSQPIEKTFDKSSVFKTRHAPGQPQTLDGKKVVNLESLKQARILLFSGIARPESFEQTVRGAGLTWIKHLKYPDHHHYTKGQLDRIADLSRQCDYLMTTEKDAVRLPAGAELGKPLLVLPIAVEFTDEASGAGFEKLILEKATPK